MQSDVGKQLSDVQNTCPLTRACSATVQHPYRKFVAAEETAGCRLTTSRQAPCHRASSHLLHVPLQKRTHAPYAEAWSILDIHLGT